MNIRHALSVAALSSLLFACSGSDGDPDAADAGVSIDASAPEPDAEPALATIDDICGEDGVFVALIEKFGECLPEF